ncbi:protein transport protein bos1 [Blastocladiella emersonii ATCC 22665]|nr:protein transport protein bos1 [Blastocladiella emersonii ATCC 22665]
MNSLYQNLLRQNDTLCTLLDRAEQGYLNDAVANQVQTAFGNLERSLADYNEFSKREINVAKREKALIRSKKFSDDLSQLRERWTRVQARGVQQQAYADQRNDLFHRSGAPSGGGVQINLGGPAANEYYSHESARLHATESQLDEYLAMGQSMLGNLTDQRNMLKRTHRRILDAANTLGLSRTLIGYIERRGVQDKWLFAAMALVSLGLMWAMIHYLR